MFMHVCHCWPSRKWTIISFNPSPNAPSLTHVYSTFIPYIYIYLYLSIYLSTYLPNQSINLSIYQSINLSIYLPTYLSIYLSNLSNLSIYLSLSLYPCNIGTAAGQPRHPPRKASETKAFRSRMAQLLGAAGGLASYGSVNHWSHCQ